MNKRIIIAGGGTGGHVYPGIAIAQAIQRLDPSCEVHFVGTERGIEKHVVPRAGFPLHKIQVGQLHSSVGLKKRLLTLIALPKSFFQCLSLCLRLQPVAVLGVGGYASGPFLLIASLLGKPTSIWEPNAIPGMANRILSRFVRSSYVVFDAARSRLKTRNIKKSGVPVRFESIHSHRNEREFHLLIFGGSQGARAINQAAFEAIESGVLPKGIQVVHQIGDTDFEKMQKRYENWTIEQKNRYRIERYLHDMKSEYERADLVVCRGGASTLAEIMACGLPAIIVPLPTAADNHQQKNAEEMVREGAAEMLLQADLNGQHLTSLIQAMRGEEGRLKMIAERVKKLHFHGAADALAKDLLAFQQGEEKS